MREADEVLDYFEDTYIGRFRRNGPRGVPLFPINMWNMFHRTQDEVPLLLWKFLSHLKKEQSLNRVAIFQIEAGHQPPTLRRR